MGRIRPRCEEAVAIWRAFCSARKIRRGRFDGTPRAATADYGVDTVEDFVARPTRPTSSYARRPAARRSDRVQASPGSTRSFQSQRGWEPTVYPRKARAPWKRRSRAESEESRRRELSKWGLLGAPRRVSTRIRGASERQSAFRHGPH